MGSGIIDFGSLKHGIGLRWLDARTLEIAVPDGLALDYTHQISFHPEQGLTYRYPDLPYRSLRADDPDYAGCSHDP
ncbi:hypothetical protein [Lysobacter sp. Root604]|uniref:hypothetical protein n=1 Tax=Lysobacter sp. Root604 TaxID=1736568 RepID=UPI0006FECE57|nr:hypothetical protein [Lysobacter sp. Root604]KRA15289.1 hypothetical protein ASD69_17590 [Lysobacter sp. Root604]